MFISIHRLSPDGRIETFENVSNLTDITMQDRVWIDVETEDELQFQPIALKFGIHELAVEDCFTRGHFPKIEEYPNFILIMLRSLKSIPELEELKHTHEVETETSEKLTRGVSIMFSDQFIITHRMSEVSWLDALVRQISQNQDQTHTLDPQDIILRVADVLTSRFYRGISFFQDKLEQIEDAVVDAHDTFSMRSLLDLKKDITVLMAIMRDQKNISSLLSIDPNIIKNRRLKGYFKNIDDRSNTILQSLQRTADTLAGVRDAYFAMSNVRLGDIMRIMAVITTIAAPLNVVVGLYGMNFEIIPLLHNPYGFWFIILAMLSLILWMILYFRRKNWI